MTDLDTLLAAHRVPGPAAALTARILAAAPVPPLIAGKRRWWATLGFAGAGLAGMMTGAAALAAVTAAEPVDGGATAFGTAPFDEIAP